jgi:hypothetical protein
MMPLAIFPKPVVLTMLQAISAKAAALTMWFNLKQESAGAVHSARAWV